MWLCKCDCGTEIVIKGKYLSNGDTKSCGCLKIEKLKEKAYDLTGQNFGRLTVIKRVSPPEHIKDKDRTYWLCECSCKEGNEVIIVGTSLTNGKTKSCGCLQKESQITHGFFCNNDNIRLYRIWQDMKNRCLNSNHKRYQDWGGRGIKVCDEWLNSFGTFYDWAIKNNYKEDLTIDRINNNGNYEPNNCKWSTRIEQQNNSRKNVNIEINGEIHTVSEWSRITGIKYQTISSRLHDYHKIGEDLIKPVNY